MLQEKLAQYPGRFCIVGVEVRTVSSGEVGLSPPTSAVCRVRGSIWVVLSSADPVSIQLEVLGEALRDHAPGVIERRFLPPAVRAILDRNV